MGLIGGRSIEETVQTVLFEGYPYQFFPGYLIIASQPGRSFPALRIRDTEIDGQSIHLVVDIGSGTSAFGIDGFH